MDGRDEDPAECVLSLQSDVLSSNTRAQAAVRAMISRISEAQGILDTVSNTEIEVHDHPLVHALIGKVTSAKSRGAVQEAVAAFKAELQAVAALEDIDAEQQSVISRLRDTVGSLQSELVAARGRLGAAEAEAAEWRLFHQELEEKSKQDQLTMQVLQAKVDESIASKDESDQLLRQTMGELEQLRLERDQLEQYSDSQQEQLVQLHMHGSKLQRKLDAVTKKLEGAQEQLRNPSLGGTSTPPSSSSRSLSPPTAAGTPEAQGTTPKPSIDSSGPLTQSQLHDEPHHRKDTGSH